MNNEIKSVVSTLIGLIPSKDQKALLLDIAFEKGIDLGLPKQVQARTYSVREAAKMIGASPVSIYSAINRGEIPCVRIGKRILLSRLVIDKMLNGDFAS